VCNQPVDEPKHTVEPSSTAEHTYIAVNIISSGEHKPRTGGRCVHNYLPEKKRQRKHSRRGINMSLSTVTG